MQLLIWGAVLICAQSAMAKDIPNSADHPILSRYPGSDIITYVKLDYEEYQLPLGATTSAKENSFEKTEKIAGAITRIGYALKKTTSTTQVYGNFVAAMKKAGFNTLYTCSGEKCGSTSGWQHFFTNSQVWGLKPSQRLIVGKKTVNKQDVYLVVFTGEQSSRITYQIDVIESKAMQTNLVEIDTESLLQHLNDEGKVALYGIHFEIDKATLLPDSAAILQVVAEVLNKDKKMRVYIVGHTDDSGSLEHNITLSQQRAQAVVTELTAKYAIGSARLIGYGVGPYAPLGNNANEAGRQKNRRVEIIKRL